MKKLMYESSTHLECPVTYTDVLEVITDAIWSKIKNFQNLSSKCSS